MRERVRQHIQPTFFWHFLFFTDLPLSRSPSADRFIIIIIYMRTNSVKGLEEACVRAGLTSDVARSLLSRSGEAEVKARLKEVTGEALDRSAFIFLLPLSLSGELHFCSVLWFLCCMHLTDSRFRGPSVVARRLPPHLSYPTLYRTYYTQNTMTEVHYNQVIWIKSHDRGHPTVPINTTTLSTQAAKMSWKLTKKSTLIPAIKKNIDLEMSIIPAYFFFSRLSLMTAYWKNGPTC